MSERIYWIWVFGRVGAALFYDLARKDSGDPPLLCLKGGDDDPQSADGLHVGMLMQHLSGSRFPPDVYFEGTVDDAKRVLRRECAVSSAELHLLTVAFENDGLLRAGYESETILQAILHQIEDALKQDDVVARLRELKIPDMMRKALEKDLPDTGIARLRARVVNAPRTTALFFGE